MFNSSPTCVKQQIQIINLQYIFFVELKVESATELSPVPPTAGLLVAEPYTWKSLVTGQPCLKIKTTGSKAAVLVLPPG